MSFLENAEEYCMLNKLRFTEPRRLVLAAISGSQKPIGAYDIIDAMPGNTKPPTVYRALEFWEKEGFIHRIDSLNAYTLCSADHRHEGSQFMICESCGAVEEIHLCHLPTPLQEGLQKAGFHLSRWNTELHGVCRDCQTQPQ